jgi:hypothetical protein
MVLSQGKNIVNSKNFNSLINFSLEQFHKNKNQAKIKEGIKEFLNALRKFYSE